MNLFLLRGSAEFFYTTSASLPERKSLQEETPYGPQRVHDEIFHWKNWTFFQIFFRMNKLAFMIFVGEIRRAGRSPPLINSKFHMGFIPEHRTKTPILKEEKKNVVANLPKTPFPPPSL